VGRPEAELETDDAQASEPPPVDTTDAIQWAYRFHRTKRRLQVERRRASQLAGLRFATILAILVFVFVVLSLTVWAEIQKLFGL
jgi:hypothetical protein